MAAQSRRVLCRPHRWHVQEAGGGQDTILLIHGAGGATQSWRAVFPRLAARYHVVAVDLPGQGFSQSGAQARFGLPETAADLLALCAAEGWRPDLLIGHSAGAAIALEMVRQAGWGCRVAGINAALGRFKGVAGWLFPLMAKTLALTPVPASVFAATATPATVRNLLRGTGSRIDAAGEAFYLRLLQDRGHVDATLSMMAQWDLDPLLAALPDVGVPVTLLAAEGDTAVPPATSDAAAARLPDARVIRLPDLGHLAHEEDAAAVLAALDLA